MAFPCRWLQNISSCFALKGGFIGIFKDSSHAMDCDEENGNPSLDQRRVYQLVFELLTTGDPRKANVFMAEMGPLS